MKVEVKFAETDKKLDLSLGKTQIVHDGENGATFTPSVSEDGTISWENNRELENPEPVNVRGATYTPSLSEEGVISWTNDKGLPNPNSVNIKGVKGDDGYTPVKGKDYFDGNSGVHIGSDEPPESANVWIDPTGDETPTIELQATFADGSTKTYLVYGEAVE